MRDWYLASTLANPRQCSFPFHTNHKLKKLIEIDTAPNILTLIWIIWRRWLRNLASICWSSTKKNFRENFPVGGSGKNWNELDLGGKFFPSSQEKILKLYSNLAKDLVGYGFFAALSKCASLLLLPVLTRLFSEDEYGTFDLI